MAQSKRKTAQCQTLYSYFSFKRRKPEEIAMDTQDESSCSRQKEVDGQEKADQEFGSDFTGTLSK